jgi:hypothetical protein
VSSVTSQPPVTIAPTPPSTNPSPNPPPTSVPATAVKLDNIQAASGWNTWGQFAPSYQDCTAPCPGISFSLQQSVSSPSLSGNAAQFNLGGTVPYSDVLFSNPVLGQFSTYGKPDNDHTLLPTIHNFVYDADFYITDASVTQVLEFDVSMYMNGVSMIWGNQCNNLGDRAWDIWDNVNQHWISTGVACPLVDKGWNHITLEVQRNADNSLLYQAFTLNGARTDLNKTYPAFTAPSGWYGITVNYQMDGDKFQSSNTTYLDNFSLTYW